MNHYVNGENGDTRQTSFKMRSAENGEKCELEIPMPQLLFIID